MRSAVIFVIAMWTMFAGIVHHASAQTLDPLDMLFVTDDDSRSFKGCERIVMVDAKNGRHVTEGEYRPSPGRLASTSDGRIVVSVNNNNAAFVTTLLGSSDFPTQWNSYIIPRPVLVGGPASIAPNDSVLLLARTTGVGRYFVRNIGRATIGQEDGRYEINSSVAAILFTSDSLTAILIRVDGIVDFIDPILLSTTRPSLTYSPIARPHESRIRKTFAAISPDDRYVVINTGTKRLSVLDLVTNTSSSLELEGLTTTFGLGFNFRAPTNTLAVNGQSVVAVYDFNPVAGVRQLARAIIPPQVPDGGDASEEYMYRPASLAWTGSGDGVVAAIGGKLEFRILDFEVAGEAATLTKRFDFEGCEVPTGYYQSAIDVISLNDRYHPPTPTPTPSPTPTDAPPPTASSTTPSTHSPTPTPSPSLTATPIPPSSTPTPTPPPSPIYLPLALRESCPRAQRRADVVLVVDASTSMLDRDAAGTVKLTAAVEAARTFLGLLALDPAAASSDQAALVAFNADATLLQPLTADRAALDAAFTRIAPSAQTCLVCAVEAAVAELATSRHRTANTPAVVLLTDGRANPRPASEAVAAAATAKADGLVFFTVALGDDVDAEALATIAAPAGRFFRSADGSGLTDIYAEVAVSIPCPVGSFWGRR